MDKKSYDFALPLLSAKAWVIINTNTGETVAGYHEHERREIASITKVMTAYTAIQIINNLNINIYESKIEASFDASLMGGTTAELEEGDVLDVWGMLHAMLLPSGNDAAYALAEYFGLVMMELGLRPTKLADPVQVFISEMNKNAKALGMNNTNYTNSHGLQNYFNKSTAADVAKLSIAAMKLPLFAEIVKKQSYKCTAQDMFKNTKTFVWKNTNKLLAKGFSGLKTGITPSAGPCMASNYKNDQVNLITVVLACKTLEHRWSDTIKLKEWGVQALARRKSDSSEVKKTELHQTKKRAKVL